MPLCLAAAPERGDGLKDHARGPDSNGLMSVYRVAIGGWAGLPSVKALQVALLPRERPSPGITVCRQDCDSSGLRRGKMKE